MLVVSADPVWQINRSQAAVNQSIVTKSNMIRASFIDISSPAAARSFWQL